MSNGLTEIFGNIIFQQDTAQQTFYFNNAVIAPTGSYTYDALYRLLTATGREQTALAMPTDTDFVNNILCPDTATNAMQNYTQNYQYDALGNMLQMQSQNRWTRDYIYDTATNRLLRHTQQLPDTYSYDTHGNMLTMPHLSNMSYDYQDQLHSAGNGTFTSYYNYDAEGIRSRKVVVKGNIREERYYVNEYEIYRKYINGTLDIERKTVNITDDEKVFVRIETKTGENPIVRYQYDNHLGSACLELDELGAIISYEEYHPFGTTSYRSGRTETEVSLKRYKYCGKERDEETGLYYYGMRYYAAWLCRFVSVDPLQFKYPELTPFQYASNRPVTMIDLDGAEGVKPEEQKGHVINAYAEEKATKEAEVSNIKEAINQLNNSKPEKSDKEAFAAYKNSLKELNSSLKGAESKLKNIAADYYEVENILNEYAYYDPEGYAQLSNYTDAEGNPIDIYVRVDPDLKINREAGQFDYGSFGYVNYNATVDSTGGMTNIRIEHDNKVIHQNAIEINIAKGGYASTIAHEKGHLDFDFYKGAEDVAYRKANPNYNKARHDVGDPSGIAADKATIAYKSKQNAIDSTGAFFNFRIHKRK